METVRTMEKRFLAIGEAAELIGLSIPTINRYVEKNTIPSHKIGGRRLFDREELIEWVRSYNSHGVQEPSKVKSKRKGG